MSRRYDDQVEVRRRDDVPAEFLWRGRFYAVRGVLDTWVETTAWWRSPAAAAVYGLGADDPVGVAETGLAGTAGGLGATGGLGAADTARALAPTGLALDEVEREVWRVEASAGRMHGIGVYDLSLDWTAGAWSLVRVAD